MRFVSLLWVPLLSLFAAPLSAAPIIIDFKGPDVYWECFGQPMQECDDFDWGTLLIDSGMEVTGVNFEINDSDEGGISFHEYDLRTSATFIYNGPPFDLLAFVGECEAGSRCPELGGMFLSARTIAPWLPDESRFVFGDGWQNISGFTFDFADVPSAEDAHFRVDYITIRVPEPSMMILSGFGLVAWTYRKTRPLRAKAKPSSV
jgi:hypothetical protein